MSSLAKFFSRTFRLCDLLIVVVSGLWRHRKLPPLASRADCAQWLHETCLRGLRAIHLELHIDGTPPTSGLLVSNHLSYLDILVYSTALPCVFVSKAEVEQWPVFGRYARWAGSVFVRRHDRADVAQANTNIAESLQDGVPVVLFPEGTTTDGQRVLRFHSTLLQPALDARVPVTPCAIGYQLDDGDVSREICWWGDMTLLPHMWNLMGKKTIHAKVKFGPSCILEGDRKQLSATLHDQVVRLRGNRS
jgi:1-acyl-sn-glycerol-3-phosphate acyltransferase